MNIDEIADYFQEHDAFLLTTHESPDGDGLGAEFAFRAILEALGKNVEILNSDPHAGKYDFFDPTRQIRNLVDNPVFPADLDSKNLVVLDTEPGNIGRGASALLDLCRDVVVIDHHAPKQHSDLRGWLSEDSSSTCEMIFHLQKRLEVPLNLDIAVALYTGIVYDTGSFIYPKTRSSTFRIAEELVEIGVVPNQIHTRLYESKSTGSLMLQSLVSSTMILHHSDQVAVQVMPRETLIASGAGYEESQEIVNFPLQCAAVRISVFFKEAENGVRRCSMRSKGEVDCAAIAHRFGGGGHKTASGFRFDGTFQDIQSEVLEEIRPYLT